MLKGGDIPRLAGRGVRQPLREDVKHVWAQSYAFSVNQPPIWCFVRSISFTDQLASISPICRSGATAKS